jgi:hypothetical protein
MGVRVAGASAWASGEAGPGASVWLAMHEGERFEVGYAKVLIITGVYSAPTWVARAAPRRT